MLLLFLVSHFIMRKNNMMFFFVFRNKFCNIASCITSMKIPYIYFKCFDLLMRASY